MPINTLVNRYRDLMNIIPEGAFYDRDGVIVPYRDSPYEHRLTTDAPNTNFGIFLNSIFQGVATSDALGNLVVSTTLQLGENLIDVVQSDTQEHTRIYLTARHYATWIAAYSDELERIDDNIDEVRLGLNIRTAFGSDLEDLWGARVGQPNDLAYVSDTYRNVLQELLQGYRLFGSKVRGHEIGVAAICQVPPLDYYRKFEGSRWILGSNFLENGYFDTKSHSVSPTPSIPGITLKRLSALAATGAASITWDPNARAITYTDSTGSYVACVDTRRDGEYSTSGSALPATLTGLAGPFVIPVGQNELRIDLDGRGMISILLPVLATTAAAIVAVINAALLADPRYGVPYSATASVSGAAVMLVAQVLGIAGSITIFAAPSAPIVFTTALLPGIVHGSQLAHFYQTVLAGPTGPFAVTGANDVLEFDIDRKGIVTVVLPNGAAVLATTIATTINNALVADPRYGISYATAAVGTGCVELHARSPFAHRSAILVYASSGAADILGVGTVAKPAPFSAHSIYDSAAAFDVVCSLLPHVTATENFTVFAAGTPDNWFISATSADLVPQIPSRNTKSITSLLITAVDEASITKRVTSAFEYKGFLFTVAAWLRTETVGVSAVIGHSFDNGVTWIESAPIAVASVASAYQDATFIADSFILDPDAVTFDIRVRLLVAGPLVVYVDLVEVRQPEITAAYLKSNTLPRSRHRSFFGHLVWAWCPDITTTAENKAIGLGTPPNWPVGHLDKIGAAHTQIDRFNVTEFDIFTGKPINLHGLIKDADWSSAALTNLDIVPCMPDRFTHVIPSVAGVQTETLIFSAAPHLAPVNYVSDQVTENTLMLRDGVPIPTSYWQWDSANTIRLDASMYDASSKYTIRYRVLYLIESEPIDLGPAWSDYIWFSDYYGFFRYSAKRTETDASTQLALNYGSFQAPLDRPAVTDTALCKLNRDDGIEVFELPQDGWGFSNAYTVTINGEYVVDGALYTLFYKEVGMTNEQLISVKLEIRSSATLAGLATATYKTANRNQAVRTHNGYRYHQLRVTLSNVDDVRDVRLSCVVLKGLNLFGQGNIPGLRP